MHFNTKLYLSIIFPFFLIPAAGMAQVNVTGKVINQTDTKPVSHASVFLNNATIGTSTDDDGTFTIKNLTPGKYSVIVSILGFDEAVMPVTVGNQDIDLKIITLYPKTVSLKAVTISSKRNDPQWSKNYDKFKTEFLGHTEFAGDCTILNPGVLQFHYDEGKSLLTASSLDFLEIENKALGYKIKYLVKEFTLDRSALGLKALSYDGYALFQLMTGSAEQESQWKKNRAMIYEGSEMHFLRAVADNDIDEEGFRIVRLPLTEDRLPDNSIYLDKKTYDALKQKDTRPIASGPDGQGIYKLINNNDRLYISYNKYHRFPTSRYVRLTDEGTTLVDFTSPDALFDNNGALLNPKSIAYDGAWARRAGVANLLPVDYQEESNKRAYAGSMIRGLAKKLKTYADSLKTEKVYLHFDKPYYGVNDTIYFKAYVTGGGNEGQLSTLSGILNVDLITPGNKINRSVKLKLNDGLAWGDFAISDSLEGGNYRIRAYTNWMRNEGDQSFFEKNMPIGKFKKQAIAKSAPAVSKSSESKASDIQFLPEGGTLIAGNYSKIAFKAIAANGLGVDVKGSITDNKGNEICKIESAHLGMGAFNMVAESGKKYTANLTFADGSTRTTPLPVAISSGYTLTINAANTDTIRLRVTAPAGTAVGKLSLIAQSAGVVYYAAEAGSENRIFSAVIPKSRLPSGIVQFTLFNALGEPLNERLIFIEQQNQSKLELIADRLSYTARQKVNIRLSSGNGDKPSTGNYSVAIIDEDIIPTDSLGERNILTELLLTSDLKGNVEQPNYYFNHPTEKTRADLDNLLLTQGYCHFSWKQLTDTTRPKFQPEKGITISGTVKRNNKPVPGAQVKLFSKAGGMFMLDTVTDVNGKFAFRDLIFADSTKFVVQSKVKKGQDDVTLELDSTRAPQLKIRQAANNEETTPTAKLTTYLASEKQFYEEQKKYGINQHSILLKEVKVEAKKDPPLIPHSQNLNGPGNADYILTAKDIEKMICGRLADCLQGVFGIRFIRGLPNVGALVVDGNFVDMDVFNDLHQDDIEGIEYITDHSHYRSIYGSRMVGGGLIITTKHATKLKEYYRYAPGVITYMPKGFYKAREFYSPQYDNPHTNQKMADLRSTVYWNPNIITDKDGKASFSYFNADGKGTYRVVIEGIDADGNLGRQVLRYKVE